MNVARAARPAAKGVRCGIAGWSYPDWTGRVYPRRCRDKLAFCARYVECIEINSTFYRPPVAPTCAAWVERTADLEISFTAKLPRAITHEQSLEGELVQQVREGFAPLRAAGVLRALLAQFSYRFDDTAAHREHLARIASAFDDLASLAVEVRHASWTEPEALAWLGQLPISLVHLDYPGESSGFGLRHTGVLGPAQLAYLRLHGRNYQSWFRAAAPRDEVYDYDYSPAEVRQIVTRIHEIAAGARQTVVIGNNHFRGQGMKVALEILAALRQREVPVPDDLVRAYPELRAIARGASRGLFD